MGRASTGKLDQRVTLQSYSMAPDGAGGYTKTWADFPSVPIVWADVTAKSGGEQFADDRTNAVAVVLFTIRNRTDVDEKDRIIWCGQPYNIRAIHRQGSREMYLRIEAERGV